jgi:hypothetical protein
MTAIQPAYSAWEVDSTHLGGFVSVRRSPTAVLGSWLPDQGALHRSFAQATDTSLKVGSDNPLMTRRCKCRRFTK